MDFCSVTETQGEPLFYIPIDHFLHNTHPIGKKITLQRFIFPLRKFSLFFVPNYSKEIFFYLKHVFTPLVIQVLLRNETFFGSQILNNFVILKTIAIMVSNLYSSKSPIQISFLSKSYLEYWH